MSDPASEIVGTVEQIAVYPVKSLAGRTVAEARAEAGGLVGDRTRIVVDAATGERVSAKTAPQMAELVATGDVEADTITLNEVLGRPVRLDRSEGPQEGVAAVHLVSRAAIARAAAGEVPEGCSADDPRANLLLECPPGVDERTWVGRRLRIGEVELRITRTPKHCLGVYAEVAAPGRIRTGDTAQLLP